MSSFPVSLGDALQISSWNALASVTLVIRGYARTEDGRWVPFDGAHVANTNRTIASTVIGLPEGELRNVTVFVSGAAPIVGQTFVRLQLVRGSGTAAIVLVTLAADYVTAVQPLAWPGSPVRRSVEGRGALRSVTGTDPAANTEISETVPTGARWRPRSIRFVLVTDANAANREVALVLDDGTNAYARIASGATQVASLTHGYTFARGAQKIAPGVALAHALPMPDVIMLAGHRIATATTAIQATDNYGAPQLLVEEHLEGAA